MLTMEHNMWGVQANRRSRLQEIVEASRRARAQTPSLSDAVTGDASVDDGFIALSTQATGGKEREKTRLAFVEKPLGVPHLARVSSDAGETVYLRFLAANKDEVAVLPDATAIARQTIEEIRKSGLDLDRFVIVGADRLMDERDTNAPGREAALQAFANLLVELAQDRVSFVWRTRAGLKGALPLPLVSAWAEVQSLLTIEMGIPTLDVAMARTLEGHHAAEPDARLRLLSAASARGVSVRAMIDPLVPMLTDQAATLRPLLAALADVGVHRVSCRYLMLTRERARALTDRMSSMHRALIRGVFAEQPWLKAQRDGGPSEAHKLLADDLRQKGHDRVMSEGANVGIAVDILDPSSARGRANRPTTRSKSVAKKVRPQLDLFGQG